MARCTHANAVITEEATTLIDTDVIDGVPQYPDYDVAERTGRVWINCEDCGLNRAWGPKAKRPRWLTAYLAEDTSQ